MMRRFIKALFMSFGLVTLTMSFSWSIPGNNNRDRKSILPIHRQKLPENKMAYLRREVRHELLTLSWYGIFDWLEGEVKDEHTVILRGQVIYPSTKSNAENRIRSIDGVVNVINEIEILPISPGDDQLRHLLHISLFNMKSPLFRYSMSADPAIHIIVKYKVVFLKGVVACDDDRQLAVYKAKEVPGVFTVNNELRIEK